MSKGTQKRCIFQSKVFYCLIVLMMARSERLRANLEFVNIAFDAILSRSGTCRPPQFRGRTLAKPGMFLIPTININADEE